MLRTQAGPSNASRIVDHARPGDQQSGQTRPESGQATTSGKNDGATLILGIQNKMAAHDTLIAAASSCCTALAIKLQASRVSIGWLDSQECRPIASSAGLPGRLSIAQRDAIGSAMLEAINQQVSLSSLNPAGIKHIVLAQKALAGNGAVVSVPLAVDGKPVGALTLEFSDTRARWLSHRINQVVRLLEQLVPVVARQLSLQYASSRPLLWQLMRHMKNRWHAFSSDHSRIKRCLLVATCGLIGAVLLVPFDQTINSESRIEGAVQRAVVAATDGYLKSVMVRPGDQVTAGQILATLGERELSLERDRLQGQVEQFRGDASTAIANGDRPAMAVAQAQVDQTNAQLALIEQQLMLTQVRTPIDGIVINGDLWQSVGSPVDRGQSLFTVAPANAWRIIIEVPEDEITRIYRGQVGQLVLSAMPWQHIGVTVDRISPVATTLAGNNVFEVHARLDAGSELREQLRPGLRGTARLAAGRANLFSRLSRRLSNALGRLWWRWQPW